MCIADDIIKNNIRKKTMDDINEINESLEKLNSLLKARVSFWRNFLLGVLTGIGSVIGAAIIGSILLGFLASNWDDIPILRNLVPRETVQEFVEE